MPASSSLSVNRATSFFDRSLETAVSFVPSPALDAHRSSFGRDSTVLHDPHEAWLDKEGVRNHVPAAGLGLVHLVASAFMRVVRPASEPLLKEDFRPLMV